MTPVEAAVLPLKEKAVDRAADFARKQVEAVKEALKEAGNDLSICAPYPKNPYGTHYQSQLVRYRLYHEVCKTRHGYWQAGPKLADVDHQKVEKYVENAKKDAALQYDAFVRKMVEKIGRVKTASLTGDHVWDYSILTIEREDGCREIWKTQMILNISKLGKVFNQYPSRKVK